MENFNREIIKTSIENGAKYLIFSQNEDGGIKWRDHSTEGSDSGIWVTAEALEFFLTSKTIPFAMHKKIEKMINFLLETQADDGCWSVLPKENDGKSTIKEASAIATGHCTYVLKLAMIGNYDESKRIKDAIRKGEDWLRRSCVERDGFAFWETKPSQRKNEIDPNQNEGSRMQFILTTFYAVFGLVNPKGYPEDSDKDRMLITKTIRFFNEQANYFIHTYKIDIERLKTQYAKVASTLCRIVNGLYLLKATIADSTKADLKLLLQVCPDPFTTSNIIMHIANVRQYAPAYNNNTPFDMAQALINLETGAEELKHIMSAYIDKQTAEGFWYLNFSDTYTVTTWSTSEALLVLEQALDRYGFIEYEEAKKELSQEKLNVQAAVSEEKERHGRINRALTEKNDKLRHRALFAMIVSIVLSIVGILAIAFWTAYTPDANPVLKTILEALIAPLAVNILSSVFMTVDNYDLIKWKKQKDINDQFNEEDEING